MAERPFSDTELDALIETALRNEPLLPAPEHLHAKVVERVQWAALQQKERARFRNALLTSLAAFVGIIALAVVLVVLTSFHILLEHGISGALGRMDYYRATLAFSWPGRLDNLFLAIVAILAAITISAGLQPLWRRGAIHAGHGNRAGERGPGGSLRAR